MLYDPLFILACLGVLAAIGFWIRFNLDNTINSTYSISSNRNAMTVGPVTVASGATITVPSGQRWIIM